MSNLSIFLAENAAKEEVVKYAASKRFLDKGKPAEWELKAIGSEQDSKLRKPCYKNVPIPGKPNQYTKELDSEAYLAALAAATVVSPDLNRTELQDSYKVMGADKVLLAMLNAGEYQQLLAKVQEVNGFTNSMNDLVEEAKN